MGASETNARRTALNTAKDSQVDQQCMKLADMTTSSMDRSPSPQVATAILHHRLNSTQNVTVADGKISPSQFFRY
jgi:hypothetical protein